MMISQFRYRTAIARVLLPIVTIWLMLMPARAYALAPAILVPIVAEAVTEAGTAIAISETSALVNLIGMTIASIAFFTSAHNDQVLIPVSQLTQPEPFAEPVLTYPHQSCAHTVTSIAPNASGVMSLVYSDVCGVTVADICTSLGGVDVGGLVCSYSVTHPTAGAQPFSFEYNLVTAANPCPTGYSAPTVSAGVDTCTLVSAITAAQDSSYNINRSTTGFSHPVQDADLYGVAKDYGTELPLDPNAEINKLLSAMFITSDTKGVQVFGKDSMGASTVYEISKRADNGSDIYILKPVTLPDQTQGTNYTKISISPNSVVESVSNIQTSDKLIVSTAPNPSPRAVSADVIEYPYIVKNGATTPSYDPLQGVVPSFTPVVSSASTTTNPGGSATFPNDYARQGEAVTAANMLAPKVDRIGDALSSTTIVADPVDLTSAEMPTFGNTFDNLLSWQLPIHNSACPSLVFDLSMMSSSWNNFVMDSHCTLIQGKTGEFQLAMSIVWTLIAMMIILRA